MKIFGWVHRRFHHKDAKKVDNNDHKESLLDNEAFANACDGWQEGILAIGTLGFDLVQDYKPKDDTFMNNQVLFIGDHDNDHDHEQEMERPLALNASKRGFDRVKKQDPLPCDEVAKPKIHQKDDNVKDLTLVKKSGERTTLADLLWGDSEKNLLTKINNLCDDDHKLKFPSHDANNNNNNDTESIKSGLISKKKKKIDKDNLAQSIKKTKQMMRKMLKKKIHPDMRTQKKETASIACQDIDVHAT